MRQQKRLYDSMFERLKQRLKRRRLFLNPFKLDPIKHMQRYAFTDQEWAALKIIRSNPLGDDCIRIGHYVVINPTSLLAGAAPFKSFRVLPQGQGGHFMMVSVQTRWDALPDSVRGYIVEWADYDLRLKQSSLAALTHFSQVGIRVRTWGQLHRLWPALLPLFPGELRSQILHKKAKSKVPDDILFDVDGVQRAIFDPAKIEESDMVFAEMMLLPLPDEFEFPDPDIDYDTPFYGL